MDAQPPQLDESMTGLGLTSGLTSIEQPFVARWQRLVSSTNWEKGRIIHEWRAALLTAGSDATEYADERWAQFVGGVSAQHVGRLRRVYHRFGNAYDKYETLFWSHFQAAIDWNDAEMWLEGAVQNHWSVADMRGIRSETLGAVADKKPGEDAVGESDFDEDFVPSQLDSENDASDVAHVSMSTASDAANSTRPDKGGEDESHDELPSDPGALIYADGDGRETIAFVQPFEDLADLPPDFAEAFDALKLAILRHKTDGWLQISFNDVVAALDALKQLARAPTTDATSYTSPL